MNAAPDTLIATPTAESTQTPDDLALMLTTNSETPAHVEGGKVVVDLRGHTENVRSYLEIMLTDKGYSVN